MSAWVHTQSCERLLVFPCLLTTTAMWLLSTATAAAIANASVSRSPILRRRSVGAAAQSPSRTVCEVGIFLRKSLCVSSKLCCGRHGETTACGKQLNGRGTRVSVIDGWTMTTPGVILIVLAESWKSFARSTFTLAPQRTTTTKQRRHWIRTEAPPACRRASMAGHTRCESGRRVAARRGLTQQHRTPAGTAAQPGCSTRLSNARISAHDVTVGARVSRWRLQRRRRLARRARQEFRGRTAREGPNEEQIRRRIVRRAERYSIA